MSFNDEVALHNAWEIFCEFKQIPYEQPIHFPTQDTLDQIVIDLREKIKSNLIM